VIEVDRSKDIICDGLFLWVRIARPQIWLRMREVEYVLVAFELVLFAFDPYQFRDLRVGREEEAELRGR
jgi:hypothetical protein